MLRPRPLRPLLRRQPRPASLAAPVRRLATTVAEEKDPVELDRITTLPNGIRVATEALPGHFSAVGVYLDAGSRYENDALRGVSHIVDRLAFKSTSKRSLDQTIESIETLGGNIQCASSRESLMYQSATFNSAVPTVVGLLAETIRDPLITPHEVEQQLETADYEIGEIWSKPELILPELVHMAAYKDNTLGNPLLCPQERLGEIDRSVVSAYRKAFYKPENMVVAFAGVDHDIAVRLTEQHFGDMVKGEGPNPASLDVANITEPHAHETSGGEQLAADPSPYTPTQEQSKLSFGIPFLKNLTTSATSNASITTSATDSILSIPPIDFSTPAHYTGGFLTLPRIPPPPNPALPRLSYIHLAFEALPISHPDIYALAVLQTLLGGGGSFSAGGPGKGMYSRLYTNVLNQHGWIESCIAFNHSYKDSGLFGIAAACAPAYLTQMLDVMCRELSSLTANSGFRALQEGEVRRAKNQLRSSLLMNLESRMVELEDLGRQVQTHGHKVGVKEMCSRIEAVDVATLRRVASNVFMGKVANKGAGTGAPTVVVQEGEDEGYKLTEVRWPDIQDRIHRWGLGRR